MFSTGAAEGAETGVAEPVVAKIGAVDNEEVGNGFGSIGLLVGGPTGTGLEFPATLVPPTARGRDVGVAVAA